MRNKTKTFIPLAFFMLALLHAGIPIVMDGPESFQGGLGSAMFSFLPCLALAVYTAYQAHTARKRLPDTAVTIRQGGMLRYLPFNLLPFVSVIATFTYFGGITTDIALFGGLLVIILHQTYILYAPLSQER